MDKEQRAREQAYQEYLALRENRSSRGNYVKDDDLYGSYFASNSNRTRNEYESGSSFQVRNIIEDTPYGNSEMRRRSQKRKAEQVEREEYLGTRAQTKRNKPVAKQGRRNKADEDKPSREHIRAGSGNKKKKKRRKRVAAG